MGDQATPVQAPAQGLTLHFFDWECGHHQDTPRPVTGLANKEQAELVLRAIASAISQPGNARAWLMDDEEAEEAYITDDYVSWQSSKVARPVIILFPAGTDLELSSTDREDIPDYVGTAGGYGELRTNWDGRSTLRDGDIALSTMTRDQLDLRERPDEELPAVVFEESAAWLQAARDEGASWRVEPDQDAEA